MKIFKSKWENMVLNMIRSSFGNAQINIVGKDEYQGHIKALISDEILSSEKNYHFFCYSCSIHVKKHEVMRKGFCKGNEILSKIEKYLHLSDAISLSINEIKYPGCYDGFIDENQLSMDYCMKPPLKNFIVIKGK